TWSKIVKGLPATEFVRAVREDPVRRGLLFAGTERGVWVSFDDGASWQTLRRNLPVVPVHDLAVNGGDLVAAPHGRPFWRARGIASRQDSLTAADSLKVDALKKSRTDSLKQAGITDSVKVDSILGVLFADTLKDEDKPWPHRPPAEPRAPNKQGLNRFVWDMK